MNSSKTILPVCLLIFLLLHSCDTTQPPPPQEVRNARTYTWTRDTLGDGSFQSIFQGIWGSSPTDVYVVGHSSDPYMHKIWHYDGVQWFDLTTVYFTTFQILDPIFFAPVQVWGAGANDVWIVGRRDTSTVSTQIKKGFILHFTGTNWEGYWLPTANAQLCVNGLSSSDIWVGGYFGQMFHYDGNSWQEYSLSDSMLVQYVKAVAPDRVYASGWLSQGALNMARYYKWDGGSWSLIESRFDSDSPPGFVPSFDIIDETIYSTNYEYITRRMSQGGWETVLFEPSARFAYFKAFGSSNAFAMGWWSDDSELIYHFDGKDWAKIQSVNKPNGLIRGAWSDDKETFLISEDRSAQATVFTRTYVLRGK